MAEQNVIAYNSVQGNGADGILAYGLAVQSTIQGNDVEGNARSGIYILSASNRVGGAGDLANVVRNNPEGVVVSGALATGNLVEGNQVSGSGSRGISLDGGGQNVVAGNTVNGSGEVGLSVENETATVLTGNQLDGNTYGARVLGCTDCRLAANTATTAADATIKVDSGSKLLVEDQAPGEVDLRDTASQVVLVDHNGQVLALPRHAPSFSSAGGTALQVQALLPGARITFDRTNLQLAASTPVAVRVADQPNMTWTVAGREGFSQQVSGLQAGSSYEVLVDGAAYQRVQADSSGTASFRYDGDLTAPKTFELRPG